MDINDTSFAPTTKIGNIIKFLKKFYNLFFLFSSQSKFIKHNATVFENKKTKTNNNYLLLCITFRAKRVLSEKVIFFIFLVLIVLFRKGESIMNDITQTYFILRKKYIINRPGVPGAVLQTPPSLIN